MIANANVYRESYERKRKLTSENSCFYSFLVFHFFIFFIFLLRSQLQRTKGKSVNRPNIATLKKTHKYHRSAIDLPTSEPFLEFCSTTSDCDDYHENRLNQMAKNNNSRIQIKTNNDQHRPRTCEKGIPNELIITSSTQKHDSSTADEDGNLITEIKEKFSSVMVSELPAIRGSKRNNSPWLYKKK